MKLDGYTPEVFLENFLEDSDTFGQETAQAIYEEIFSAVCGKKVKLDKFVGLLNDEIEYATASILSEGPTDEAALADYAAQAINSSNLAKRIATDPKTLSNWFAMANAPDGAVAANGRTAIGTILNGKDIEAAKQATNLMMPSVKQSIASSTAPHPSQGLLSKIGGFIRTLPGKVRDFFGGLQGKSFSEIMKQGMSWLAANPVLALKTTGGIALIALLIRALKKKNKLRDYANLARIEAKSNTLKEDCYDTIIEDTKEKEAMRKILEECKTNKRLAEVILG